MRVAIRQCLIAAVVFRAEVGVERIEIQQLLLHNSTLKHDTAARNRRSTTCAGRKTGKPPMSLS